MNKNRNTRKSPGKGNPSGKKVQYGKNNNSNYSVLILLMLIGVYILFCNNIWHIQDDTFISLRYVKNFINGEGLVFNPNDRVEGYTNFLWVMILSGAALLQIDPVNASQYLSFISGIIVIILLYLTSLIMLKKSLPSADNKIVKFAGLIPVFLIVLSGNFVYWAVSGMESTMFVALILGGIYFYFKHNNYQEQPAGVNYATSILLALASLTRPEGILIALILFTHKILYSAIRSKKHILGKQFFIEFSVFALPVMCHFIFRYLYYGYLLPNTFYAKANFDIGGLTSGLNYLLSFIKSYLLYGSVLLIIIFSLRNKIIIHEITLLFLFVVVYSLYVVFVGGDVLAQHRFWLPVLPAIYILFTCTLVEINNLTKKRYPLFILLLVIGVGLFNYINNQDGIIKISKMEISLVNKMKYTAETINELEREKNKKITIATSTIGSLSYYTDADVIDMLGLTDAYIAHHPQFIDQISNDPAIPWKEKRFNADYVVNRNPDFILFSTNLKPSSLAERALFTINKFYQLYFVQPYGNNLFFFVRKNNYQMSFNKQGILNEIINPAFLNQYIMLCQTSNAFNKSRDTSHFNSVTNEFNKTEALRPSFFAYHYWVYGNVLAMTGNITAARELYNKAIATDSMNVLSYQSISLTFNEEKDGEVLEKYKNEMEKHLSVQPDR